MKKEHKNMQNKLLTLVLTILTLLLSVNLIRSWLMLSSRTNILDEAEEKLYEEMEEKKNLERELAKVQSREFVEKQIREKLNMGKEGEIVVIVPSPAITLQPTPTPIDTSSNLEKWRRIFF